MRRLFFPKLAASNLCKNLKVYFPFVLVCIATAAMFYIVCALSNNSGIESRSVLTMLKLASRVAAVFAFIFLFYTNSFLMKRRKMEFGLYNILGMGKKHIALTIVWETGIIAAASIVPGVAAGVVLDKLMFLIVIKIIGGAVPLGFAVSPHALTSTLTLFTVIFAIILLNSLRQIFFSKPVELLKGGQVGEREPKVKWLIAAIGLISLGAGYYIAITVKNPTEVINMFLIAVILVMVGTYCLFTAGSIALLKLLRKNKRYYYKTKHFISTSGMIYRMKQNAVGLGNICILSTAVLVMLSTTLSLYIGLEDVLITRYPQSVAVYVNADNGEQLSGAVNAVLTEKGLNAKNKISFSYLDFAALENGDTFTAGTDSSMLANISNVRNLVFIPLDDYNTMVQRQVSLEDGEALLYTNRGRYVYNTIQILDESFLIKEKLDSVPCGDILASDVAISHYIVVKDMEAIAKIQTLYAAVEKDEWLNAPLCSRVSFDLDAEPETIISASELIQSKLNEAGITYRAECRDAERGELLSMYGGLFFVGIFLGMLFIMATVLIIYYKQITEGYGDKERFVIMKNFGLSRAEIKNTIRSQILSVFFLPLVAAGLHIFAAFPALTQILGVLNLTNVPLFIVCTLACFVAFALFYTVVYSLTARTYYRIVG